MPRKTIFKCVSDEKFYGFKVKTPRKISIYLPSKKEFLSVFKEETGEISLEMAESVKERLEDIMEYELSIVNDLINKNKAHAAYGYLIGIISIINQVSIKLPSLQRNLAKNLYQIRITVENIAKKVDAKNFSIGMEPPQGILINISFQLK